MRVYWVLVTLLILLIYPASAIEINKEFVNRIENGEVLEMIVGYDSLIERNAVGKQTYLTPTVVQKIDKVKLAQLLKNNRIKYIEPNLPVSKQLATSADVVNASRTWNLTFNGTNMDGSGQTVCIIDTGIEYTHQNFGACNIERIILQGNVESHSLESDHPYENSTTYNFSITKTGYESIAVHFTNISLETGYDFIEVYDSSFELLATYTGDQADVWTPHVSGETIYFNLTTDNINSDFGFVINATINGTTNTTINWSSCGFLLDGIDIVNSDLDPLDDDSHGTHVAGIVAGRNETYTGIAPGANLIIAKALNGSGDGTIASINLGIEWCIQKQEEYNVSVISMSLGTSSHYSTFCDGYSGFVTTTNLINLATSRNISVIVSSGNNGEKENISSPACITNSIAIGATTKADGTTGYSQAGIQLDFFAPGSSITSSKLSNTFVSDSGTSMAAPHASGMYAMMYQYGKQVLGGITPLEIYHAFNTTGVPITDGSTTRQRMDVYNALLTLDTILPTITVNSPVNGIRNNSASQIFNITTDEELQRALLNINNTNISMNGSGTDWYYNYTFPANIIFAYTFHVTDLAGNQENSSERTIIVNQFLFNDTNPSFNTEINEPSNQTFNFTLLNIEEDSYDVEWYLDGTSVSSEENYTFIGNYSSQGVFNITVIVNDSYGNISYSWNLTVNDTNRLPQILTYEPNLTVNIAEPSNMTFNQTSSDDENLTFYWFINGALNETIANFTFIGGYQSAGSYNITLVIADNETNISMQWNLTVNNTNTAPVFTLIEPNQTTYVIGINNSVLFNHTSTDTDGDMLYYNWTLNGSQAGNESSFSVNQSGIINLSVTDGVYNISYQWNITTDPVPIWGNMSNQTITEGDLLNITLNVTDDDTLIFSSDFENFTFVEGNLIFDSGDYDSNITSRLYASDNITTVSINFSLDIIPVNDQPNCSVIPNITWSQDNSTIFNITDYCIDVDNQTLIFDFNSSSSNINASIVNGTVNITPANSYTGTSYINFTISDGNYTITSNNVFLTVNAIVVDEVDDDDGGNGGGGGGGGGAVISTPSEKRSKIFTGIGKGKKYYWNLNDIIDKIEFEAEEDSSDGTLTIEKVDDAPSMKVKVYQFLNLSKNGVEFRRATITFAVEKDWAVGKEISLYRYYGGWGIIPTKFTLDNSTHRFYEATTPGFSYFAIAEVESEETNPQEIQEEQNNQVDTLPTDPIEEQPATIDYLSEEDNRSLLPVYLGTIAFILIIGAVGIFFYEKRKLPKNEQSVQASENKVDEQIQSQESADVDPRLSEYVREALDKGFSKNQIEDALKKAGWDKENINQVLFS